MVIAVYPVTNSNALHELYEPLIQYLQKGIPDLNIQLVTSASYNEFEIRMRDHLFDLVFANPNQALEGIKAGYTILAKSGDDEKYRGIIVVRKGSGIQTLADLKGKKICFPAPTAFASTMMNLYYLQTHGLDVNHDIVRNYCHVAESVFTNVYVGNCSAGGVWLLPWEKFRKTNPAIAELLEVKWQTPALVNCAWLARNDMKKATREKLLELFLGLPQTETGRKILEKLSVSKYEPADEATYKPVADFLNKYNLVIH